MTRHRRLQVARRLAGATMVVVAVAVIQGAWVAVGVAGLILAAGPELLIARR